MKHFSSPSLILRLASAGIRFLGVLALAFGTHASQIRFSLTNGITGLPDTNSFLVYHVGSPVLANGSVTTIGLPIRYRPDTNGIVLTNMFAAGNYMATNAYLGNGIVFRCFSDNSSTIWNVFEGPPTGLAISGFNTFNVGFFTADAIEYLATNSFNGNLITASNFLYEFAATNWIGGDVSSGVSNQWRLDATNTARYFADGSTNFTVAQSNLFWTALLASTNGLASRTYVITATNDLNLSFSNALWVSSNALFLASVSATNNALLLSSNFTRLLSNAATNNDTAVSNNLRNLIYSVGTGEFFNLSIKSNLDGSYCGHKRTRNRYRSYRWRVESVAIRCHEHGKIFRWPIHQQHHSTIEFSLDSVDVGNQYTLCHVQQSCRSLCARNRG
jgi:hypothetical protein